MAFLQKRKLVVEQVYVKIRPGTSVEVDDVMHKVLSQI